MKICRKCGEAKDLSQFYKHGQMEDGHLNFCISCKKSDAGEYRNANLERIKEYDRKRGRTEWHKGRSKIYREKLMAGNPEEYKSMRKQTVKKHREKFREKNLARVILNNAVRDGNILKPEHCGICGGKAKLEAHHFDYSKPLEVIWVCDSCHKGIHVMLRERARENEKVI